MNLSTSCSQLWYVYVGSSSHLLSRKISVLVLQMEEVSILNGLLVLVCGDSLFKKKYLFCLCPRSYRRYMVFVWLKTVISAEWMKF